MAEHEQGGTSTSLTGETMDSARTPARQRTGLRERKKAKTRALIQKHALRLFREHGYAETSIDEIAEAAEVSRSTVLRYFPSKSDLVIYDSIDQRVLEAFHAQPHSGSAVTEFRAIIRTAFASPAAREELSLQNERLSLIRSVPELRAATMDELTRTLDEIVELIAERSGRPQSDNAVISLAGAVIGVAIAAWFAGGGEDRIEQILDRIDAGLALLEKGFNL
jgi:AcrR family transcriptional regulator